MRMFRIIVLLVPFAIMVLLLQGISGAEYLKAEISSEREINMINIISDEDRLRELFHTNTDQIISFFSDKEDLFSEYVLLMIHLTEPSKDIYHEILKIKEEKNALEVYVKRIIPERVSSVPGKDTYLIKVKRNIIIRHDNYSIVFT